MAAVALTYTDREIRVAAFERGRLLRARFALPPGLVTNGRIIEPNQFSHIIAQTLDAAQPKPITATSFTIGLPEEQAFIKIIEMPAKLKGKELRQALEFQWQNLLPISPDQVYFDIAPLFDQREEKKVTNQRYIVVAFPKELVESVLESLKPFDSVPKKILPLSFGYADLFSDHRTTTTMIISSETGKDVSVALAQHSSTRFSTVIHAPVTSPAAGRQLDNIRSFYQKNIPGEPTVDRIVVVTGPYTEPLKALAATTKITIDVPDVNSFIGDKHDSAYGNEYAIPLLGLLKTKFPLSIIPTNIAEAIQTYGQRRVMRTTLVYMGISLGICVYLSLIFLGSLHVNAQSKGGYASTLVTRVTTEADTATKTITDANTAIQKIVHATTQRVRVNHLLAAAYTAGEQTPGITLSRVSIDATGDKLQLRIEGVRASRDAMQAYATALKQQPALAKATIEIGTSNLQNEGEAPFVLTVPLDKEPS